MASMIDNLIEGVTAGLIKRMGIDPAHIVQGFNQTLADARTVKNELLGAKQGFIGAAQQFKAQLDRIEQQNAAILRGQGMSEPDIARLLGKTDHEHPQIEQRRAG